MLKRLLTYLAIFTGLAAAGAPMHVAAAGSLGVALEQSQRADQSDQNEQAACDDREDVRNARIKKPKPCRPAGTITVVIPTVMFGPDRAFE